MRVTETLRYFIGPLELIHEQAGPRLLRLARIGIFALWIVKLLLDPLWRLAEMPRGMLQPVGILGLLPAVALDELFTPAGLTSLLLITLLVLILCLTNRAFSFFATLAAILLTVYSSVIRSFGPAVHTDIVLLLAVYALAGYAWADLAEPKASGRYSYPLITILAMLCLAYTFVGLNRVVTGGLSVFTGDTMEAWTVDASLRGYYFNTNLGWHVPQWPVVVFLLRSGLPVITLFEITAPLCLAWSRYRWVFIPVMLSFHALSLVFMNIFFFDDMLLYLLLIDWSRKFPAMRSAARSPA
jgi:hypothetical protein